MQKKNLSRAIDAQIKYKYRETEVSSVTCRRENAERHHTTREDL